MKTLQHQGFEPGARGLGTYQYAIGVAGGRRFVAFRQTEVAGKTSITNIIEGLASQVLANDLAGVAPDEVDFFEFYPPHLKPLQEWQKVTFDVAAPLYVKPKGFLRRVLWSLIRLIKGPGKPDAWAVTKPMWEPIASAKMDPEIKAAVR